MPMSKQDFIALADVIRVVNARSKRDNGSYTPEHFSRDNIQALADFCQSQNPRFMRQRWLDYIAGECGPNGGRL